MKTAEIISFHPGKQHNFEQAEELVRYFDPVRHITSVAFSKKTISRFKFLPRTILDELDKRSVNSITADKVDTYPWQELLFKWKRLTKQHIPDDFFKSRNLSLQEQVLKNYKPPRVFIGFDTSSHLIFERWKGKSTLVLDLTIAAPQYKKKLAEDYKLSKENFENLVRGDAMWYDVYKREVELADFVLCGSEFVKQSCLYMGAPEEKLKVIPYGANLEKFVPLVSPADRAEQPFKIAFVGNVSYRKGADVLLSVWEKIIQKHSHAELHFYGNLQIDVQKYNLTNVFFHGFVLQSELIKELSECHVSLLPTFFEGSSYAIYQSMALGLAVVTTPNCGSVIEHMQNGVLIEYGSETQIFDAISMLIEDKALRVRLSERAISDIREFTWQAYGKKLKDFICNI